MLLILFKSLYFDNYPKYLKDLFVLRSTTYSFTGTNIYLFLNHIHAFFFNIRTIL